MIELPFPTMINAMKGGQVDAVSLIDPFTTISTSSGTGRVLAWSYVDAVPGQPTSVWFAKKAYIEHDGDTVDRFIKAQKEAIDILNSDKEKTISEISAFTGISPELAKIVPLPNWDYKVNLKIWRDVIAMMSDAGVLKNPRNPEDYMSPQMAAGAIKN